MNRATPIIGIFLLFTLLAEISRACLDNQDLGPYQDDNKCLVDIHSDIPLYWVEGDNQIVHYERPADGGIYTIPNGCRRSNIFGGDRYVVAYPSPGGVVFLKDPSAVDLRHLGLPNTHDTARLPDEDDDLATRMVQLGAQWWPDWNLYFRHSNRIDHENFYDYHFPSEVHVAFPSTGGVWVANFTRDALRWAYEDKDCESWLPNAPNVWRIKMRYALTMDDKSEMMKDMGATFYSSVDEVPGLAKTIDKAVSLFEPFRERLENMEDDDYERRFCSGYEDEDKDTANKKAKKPKWGIGRLFDELR